MQISEEKIIQAVLKEYQTVLGSLEKKSPESPNIGIPPVSLIIQQIQQYKSEGLCLGDPIAIWKVTEKNNQKLNDLTIEPNHEPFDGMYFNQGSGNFAISPDLMKVVIEWQVGPRYGRGNRYSIITENGNLTIQIDSHLWVS